MKYALLFFILIYAKSCDSKKATIDSLEGTWKITAIQNTEITTNDATKCTINIGNSTIVMTVGCNNHTGELKMVSDKIQVSNVFATEKYCPKLDALEKQLSANLPVVSDFNLKNNELELLNTDGDTVFTLVKKVP